MNNEWNCPKGITNTIDAVIAEDYTGIRLTRECKCCGEVFEMKNPKQKFCCRQCSDKFHAKMEELKSKYGNDFKKWLGKSIKEAYY